MKRRVPYVLGGVALALVVWLYGFRGNAEEVDVHGRSAVLWMVRRWGGAGGDLSHGWVIPLVSAYVLWRRRKDLAAAPKSASTLGLAVVIASLALYGIGVRTQLTRLTLLSLIGLLWGVPFYFLGASVARLLMFPCAYLVFCIPLSFLNNITVPLRLAASVASSALLNGLGIQALRQGTIIYSSAGGGFNFDVADPCSGLRSLLAMMALTAAYAVLTQPGLWRKIALFAAGIPLAMAGNIARIVVVAAAARFFGTDTALRIYHDVSGMIVFVVAIVLMLALSRVLKTDYGERMRAWTTRVPDKR